MTEFVFDVWKIIKGYLWDLYIIHAREYRISVMKYLPMRTRSQCILMDSMIKYFDSRGTNRMNELKCSKCKVFRVNIYDMCYCSMGAPDVYEGEEWGLLEKFWKVLMTMGAARRQNRLK